MGLSTFLARCVSAGRLGHKTWHHCRRTCTLGKPSPHGSGHDCGTWLWRTEVHGGYDAQGNAEILWAALRLRVLNRIITSLDTKQLFLVPPGWILHSCHRSCNSAHVYRRLHSTSSLIWLHFFFLVVESQWRKYTRGSVTVCIASMSDYIAELLFSYCYLGPLPCLPRVGGAQPFTHTTVQSTFQISAPKNCLLRSQ